MRAHWVHASGRAFDVAAIGIVVAVDLAGMVVVAAGGDAKSPSLGVGPVLVSAVCAAPFWWRRERPLSVLLAVCVAAVIAAAVVAPGLLSQQTGLSAVLAVYAVGSWSARRRRAVIACAVLLGLFLLGSADDPDTDAVEAVWASAAVIALPFAAGTAARSRRSYVEEVEQRLATAERERDAVASRAVADERNRIARELHDVVAHHVSLIGVQAGAARTALGTDPPGASDALASIEATSREAVAEMRRLLGALRGGDDAGTEPPPALADLDRLVAGFGAAGLDVDLRRAGPLAGLPPSLGLSGYRIVEEALTNVVRHSAATSATVVVEVDAGAVRIVVDDPGPPRNGTAAGAGRGHLGMQERVAVFGGTLDVGPDGGGGWRVAAVLPR